MSGTVGGRYELDARLGEGGMGCVYRARHLQLGKVFALKLISPAFALDSVARARFTQEARLASEISHPNIVSIVDYGEDPTFGAYMVMELVEGTPLLESGELPMHPRRACDVLVQIADALEHIHRCGIVHGDVKADNIMYALESDNGRRHSVRLLDFGLARRAGGAHDGEITGSPPYLAPERAAGGPPTVSGDIYALGVLGYQLLTGTLPFEGGVVEVLMAHIHDPVEPMSKRRGQPLGEPLERMIGRALDKDPRRRHPSAAALRYEVDTVMEMFEMTRRRTFSGAHPTVAFRDSTLVAAFERSSMPQALVTPDGTITFANSAFNKLLDLPSVEGLDLTKTPFGMVLADLVYELREVHATGVSSARHLTVPRVGKRPLELEMWIAPLSIPGSELHVLVRTAG